MNFINNSSFEYSGVVDAFNELPNKIKELGWEGDSRNGKVWSMPHPITVKFNNPRDRILYSPSRDANPTFHLVEALWMLAGRNDTASLTKYVKRMQDYSDDGETFHAAYGHRWRHHFGLDQLQVVVDRLLTYRNDRRTILAMWDGECDLSDSNDMKDLPCNMLIKFSETDNDLYQHKKQLNMTVFNRSNDVILGMLGANIVHMTILQEYIASKIGAEVGYYYVMSDDVHLYENLLHKLKVEATPMIESPKLFTSPMLFMEEVKEWFEIKSDEERAETNWRNEILNIASDLCYAHKIGKLDRDTAISFLDQKVEPWRIAAKLWHSKRKGK